MIRIVKQIILIVALVLLLFSGIVYLLIPNRDKQAENLGWCGTESVLIEGVDSILLSHPGRVAFENNCSVCHDVRSVVVGPALMNISERRDSVWIRRMIRNGMELIESGDSTANQLFQDYNETVHPAYTYLADSTIDSMIEYIDFASDRDIIYISVPAVVP